MFKVYKYFFSNLFYIVKTPSGGYRSQTRYMQTANQLSRAGRTTC